MKTDDFDFELPKDRIALRPAEPRGASKLMVVRPSCDDQICDYLFSDLGTFLRPGDALVFNNTQVIPARLSGKRVRGGSPDSGAGARIEANLLREENAGQWQALIRPAKKVLEGDQLIFRAGEFEDFEAGERLAATVAEKRWNGEVLLSFDLAGEDFVSALSKIGGMPLPPYIASQRQADLKDETDYQTIFAAKPGAVASPTAGLHFTDDFVASLTSSGVQTFFVTLHVGAGTFLPVSAEEVKDHSIHSEFAMLDEQNAAALNDVKDKGGRIVGVGTTTLRVLESAVDQSGQLSPFLGETNLFITPGYRFKFVDLLITNFHLPRSTLFMLVSAFSGLETMKKAYAHAVQSDYRFYSYGDACLLFPQPDGH